MLLLRIDHIFSIFSPDLLLLATTASFEKVAGYVSVALLGTVKFWVSVIMALSFNYSLHEVFLSGSLGAIIGVGLFAFFGTQIRRWWEHRFPRKRPRSFAYRRKIYLLWKKYGLWGVAFLGPFISPPVAVAIAVSFKERPARILLSMSVSIVFWTLIFTAFRDVMMNVVNMI